MKKIICPNCGSEDLRYFEEKYYTKYYVLDKNNNPTKKMKYRTPSSSNGCYNYICNNCNEIFGGSSDVKCAYKKDNGDEK